MLNLSIAVLATLVVGWILSVICIALMIGAGVACLFILARELRFFAEDVIDRTYFD